MAQVTARDENFQPPISSDLLTIPAVHLKLTYSEGPAGILRKTPAQWNIFAKHFKEKFDPRLKMRQELLFKQMVNDVRDWEIEAEALTPEKKTAFVNKMNTELEEWLNRWVKIVEKDCVLSCDEAYAQTIKEIKGKVSTDHFTASAKAVASASVKVADVALAPASGLVALGKSIFEKGKSLKTTVDKFKSDWGTLAALVDTIHTDVAAVQLAINAHERAQAAAAGKTDKLAGFWATVQAPATKLAKDVISLDDRIVLARQEVQDHSAAITALQDSLKKAPAGGDVQKAQALLTVQMDLRDQLTAELARAAMAKSQAQKIYNDLKEAKVPEMLSLTGTVDTIKKGKSAVDSYGKDATDLIAILGEMIKHF